VLGGLGDRRSVGWPRLSGTTPALVHLGDEGWRRLNLPADASHGRNDTVFEAKVLRAVWTTLEVGTHLGHLIRSQVSIEIAVNTRVSFATLDVRSTVYLSHVAARP